MDSEQSVKATQGCCGGGCHDHGAASGAAHGHDNSGSGLAHTHVIDALALDEKTGEVALIMTEPRAWDGSDERLYQLQEKLNTYLSFALDGEMAEAYPDFAGRPLRLQLDCAMPPDERTMGVIAMVREQIGYQGIKFEISVAGGGCECGSSEPCGE